MSGNDTHAVDTIEEILDALRELDQLRSFPNESLGSPKAQRALVTLDALVAERDRFEVALMIACAEAVGPEIGCDKMVAEYDRLLALAAERAA